MTPCGCPPARAEVVPRPEPAVPHRDHRGRLLLERERSEEHTSELQSRQYLVCRLLLEKKKTQQAPRGASAPSCPYFLFTTLPPPISTLFPYTTLFRSVLTRRPP